MLDSLFTSKARIAVLKAFLLEPQGSLYLRELEAVTGLPIRGIQLEVKRLTDAGVLEQQRSGNRTYYRINEGCSIVPELRSMFEKTLGIEQALRNALATASSCISRAWIFGSLAKGQLRPDSDIDILIVGAISPLEVTALLRSVSSARPLNPVVLSEGEYESRLKSGDHFLKTVLDEPRIDLMGEGQ